MFYIHSVRLGLAYKPYFFSQRTVFFSHNKSANSTFSHVASFWKVVVKYELGKVYAYLQMISA